jgi:hypothetical protein
MQTHTHTHTHTLNGTKATSFAGHGSSFAGSDIGGGSNGSLPSFPGAVAPSDIDIVVLLTTSTKLPPYVSAATPLPSSSSAALSFSSSSSSSSSLSSYWGIAENAAAKPTPRELKEAKKSRTDLKLLPNGRIAASAPPVLWLSPEDARKKLVVLDEGDGDGFYPPIKPDQYLAYFKRSWIKRESSFSLSIYIYTHVCQRYTRILLKLSSLFAWCVGWLSSVCVAGFSASLLPCSV